MMINRIPKFLFMGVCSVFLASCAGDDEPESDFTAEVSVTTSDATGKEGDNDASFSIQLSRENTSGESITVMFSLAGTATAGEDYSPISTAATIAPGETTASVSIDVTDDTAIEGDETVKLTLDASNLIDGVSVGSGEAEIVIEDDDVRMVSVSSADAAGTEGDNDMSFVITLDQKAPETVSIPYLISGTATAGADYSALSGSVEITAGNISTTINIEVTDDAVVESNETVIISINEADLPSGVSLSSTASQTTLTIKDNDNTTFEALVAITASDASGQEGSGDAEFTVSLDKINDSGMSISIPYTVTGTATNGTDYTTLGGTVEVANGASSATIKVAVINDTDMENDETVIITLESAALPSGITLGSPSSAIATISDDGDFEAVVNITASDATAKEGDNDGTFTISLDITNSSGGDIVVPYAVSGTATASNDYQSLSGTAIIGNGASSVSIPVSVIDDSDVEGSETVIVTLKTASLPTGIVAGTNTQSTVTITDNDVATTIYTVTIVGPPTATEGNATANFKVKLDQTNNTGAAITINYTLSGTAVAGSDYTAPSGSVSINNGSSEKVVGISLLDDTSAESDETLIITLSSDGLPSNVQIGSPDSKTITISDDDVAVACSNDNSTDQDDRGCTETPVTNQYDDNTVNFSGNREVVTNGIPTHDYRNQIPEIVSSLDNSTKTYEFDNTPVKAGSVTNIAGNDGRPQWKFGVAKNGVAIDPAPAEPFIFENSNTGEYNWDWVMEPNNNMNEVGLDCAIAHVQPDGLYHYHGNMGIYAEQLSTGISTGTAPADPVQIGWAADGFPILYIYGPNASGSGVEKLTSSYQLKAGERPGDGTTEPCGEYNGKYTNDYEYVNGAGDLDECNGIDRSVTLATGTYDYFYVITEEFPVISRCIVGTPNSSFKIGP